MRSRICWATGFVFVSLRLFLAEKVAFEEVLLHFGRYPNVFIVDFSTPMFNFVWSDSDRAVECCHTKSSQARASADTLHELARIIMGL